MRKHNPKKKRKKEKEKEHDKIPIIGENGEGNFIDVMEGE